MTDDPVARVRAVCDLTIDTGVERVVRSVYPPDDAWSDQAHWFRFVRDVLAILDAQAAEIERLSAEVGRWKAKVDQIIVGVTPADIGMEPVEVHVSFYTEEVDLWEGEGLTCGVQLWRLPAEPTPDPQRPPEPQPVDSP